MYSNAYTKRKAAFAAYAVANADAPKIGGMTAATVAIYRNAMKLELVQLHKLFFVCSLTYDEILKCGSFTEEFLESYARSPESYARTAGCLSVLLFILVVTGTLLVLA